MIIVNITSIRRIRDLLVSLRAAATEECKSRGDPEACSLALDIEHALRALNALGKVN